jgi:hypothetical protein
MNRKSSHLAVAMLLVLAAGCGDQPHAGPPPGVDPKASQTPAAITGPVSPRSAKAAKRDDLHRPGPSMTLEE